VNLDDSRLDSSDFTSTQFFDCRFSGAILYFSDLKWVKFIDCDLTHIRLRTANSAAKVHTSTFFGRIRDSQLDCIQNIVIRNLTRKIFKKPAQDQLSAETYVETCSQIRLCFRDNGLFHEAAPYRDQEEYWRTRYKLYGTDKERIEGRFRLFFFEIMTGYGRRSERIVFLSIGIIVLCAIAFFVFGFQVASSKDIFQYMNFSSFIFLSGEALTYFLECILLSVETFFIEKVTKLDLTSIQPAKGVGHFVAVVESIVGMLLIARFAGTWARKAIRD